MLSRPANRQSDDIAGGIVPFVKYSVATKNERLERMRGERDLAIRSLRFEKDKSAPQLQIGRRFRKITMTVHSYPSPLKYAEQLGNTQRLSVKSNSDFINFDGFRPTDSTVRQVEA